MVPSKSKKAKHSIDLRKIDKTKEHVNIKEKNAKWPKNPCSTKKKCILFLRCCWLHGYYSSKPILGESYVFFNILYTLGELKCENCRYDGEINEKNMR